MDSEAEPVVGRWYKRLDNDLTFMIVQLDEDQEVIEIELVDGERDELDLDSWADLEIEPVEEPSEWIGRPDDIEPDDMDLEGRLANGSRDSGLDLLGDDEDADDDSDEDEDER